MRRLATQAIPRRLPPAIQGDAAAHRLCHAEAEGLTLREHFAFSAPLNWFPGHMAKASREIAERMHSIDLVIEVRDARVRRHSLLLLPLPAQRALARAPLRHLWL